jgi:hypothetical protein
MEKRKEHQLVRLKLMGLKMGYSKEWMMVGCLVIQKEQKRYLANQKALQML